MIRVAIIGCNFGLAVHLPALRSDPRADVVALAGRNAARTAEHAKKAGIANAFGDWRTMLDSMPLDAVTIAVPPDQQAAIAIAALQRGLAVFAEKPMAASLADAEAMVRQVGDIPTMLDFEFTEMPAWRAAKALIDSGALGQLRSVAVNWSVENQSTRLRLRHWKTNGASGGGALGNFVSHSVQYLEWLAGPIAGLSAHIGRLPDAPDLETSVSAGIAFASGATGSLSMSCAAYLGSGHRIEIYGEAGTLVLANATRDYMRGFTLLHARRPAETLEAIAVENDPADTAYDDGRIAPTARLMQRFLDSIEQRQPAEPGFRAGLRTQILLEAIRRSHVDGRWIETGPSSPTA
jgi:predicted dehydrogenase